MRIPSGSTDKYLYFVAVDATDYVTRETGLSSFTVARSRNGAADAAYTTPTVTEIDATTMPGVYALLLDEDTTLGAGVDSEEVCVHITHTGMAPVTRTFELYRQKITAGETLTVTSGLASANATQISGDGTAADTLELFAEALDQATGQLDSGSLAAGTITAASIAADAIGASELAADAIAEIADAVWDEDATGHQTTGTFGQAIGDPVADTNTIYGAVVTGAAGATVAADIIAVKAETATILADTNELQTDWVNGGRLDLIVDAILDDTDLIDDATSGLAKIATDVAAILVDTGTTLQAELDGIQADTEDIQSKIGTPAGVSVSADILAVKSDTAAILADTGTDGVVVSATSVRTAVGLASANLDTQLGDIPTNAELATSQAAADDATLAAIATAQADLDILTGVDGAVLATLQPNYAPSTAASLTTVEGKIDTVDTVVDAIKAKTDNLAFTGGNVHANVEAVNAQTVTGSGTAADPWGP